MKLNPQVLINNKLRLDLSNFSKGAILCFLAGFFIRLVPEILAFPNPIGFDTIYYASRMKSGHILLHWSQFFTSTWLLYALIVPLYSVSRTNPFLLLKFIASLMYGLNVAGIYWFAGKMLNWNNRRSLLTGCFFAVQLASLRISWDLLRNTLGMALLLFTLSLTKKLQSKRDFVCFALLSLLVVFSHECAAVTLFTIILGSNFQRLIRGRIGKNEKNLFLGLLPALIIFLIGIYLRVYPLHYEVRTNVIDARDEVKANVGGLFFLVNYLDIKTSVDSYSSYLDLALNVLILFSLLYMPYLLLVLKGFFRHKLLDYWTGLLLIGSFGCLIVPFCALMYWHRWMFMLVYPFTFYAVNGIAKLRKIRKNVNFNPNTGNLSKKAKCIILLTIILGCVYLTTPVLMSTLNIGIFSAPSVCRYFSFTPTVPYQDVADVIEAMKWLNESMDNASCVILHHAFLFWGKLYLNDSHVIVHFVNDIDLAINACLENGFNNIYFVWWNPNIGWYGITVPNYFTPVKEFGRISIFKYSEQT